MIASCYPITSELFKGRMGTVPWHRCATYRGRADRVVVHPASPLPPPGHGSLAMAFVTYLVTDVLALAIVVAMAALLLLV